jgi:hypothetical protein
MSANRAAVVGFWRPVARCGGGQLGDDEGEVRDSFRGLEDGEAHRRVMSMVVGGLLVGNDGEGPRRGSLAPVKGSGTRSSVG